MGHVDVAGVRYELPDGRVLLDDVSFRVGEGAKVALVGANGAGKTTLLRIITGALSPHAGVVTRSGGLGVMRQMVGTGLGDAPTVADLLLSVAPPRVQQAAAEVDRCERALMDTDDEKTQMDYAHALSEYADAGGYELEVTWDVCTIAGLGVPYDRAKYRELRTLSGGEQKRLVLEYLLRGPDEVLLLDEPDNFLDVPGKVWLEQRIRESDKTILYISHDRELLDNTATRVVTVELGNAGNLVWTHPGGFASYHEARKDRFLRFEEQRRRWDEEHAKLKTLVQTLQAEGDVQRRHGEPLPGGADPAPEVRGGRAADRAAARAAGEDAAQGRPHRQARRRLREPRAHRPDEAVRPRGLVRRAGGGARQQRLRQVALPAAARRRRQRPGRRAPARRRRAGQAGATHGQGQAGRPGPSWLVRADPRPSRAAGPHAARDPAPR